MQRLPMWRLLMGWSAGLPLGQATALSSLFAALLLMGAGCNEIVGIKGATKDDAPPAISCSPEFSISAARAEGCMFRIGCDPFFPPFTMSQCVSLAWQDASPMEACGYGAQSCADVAACIGRGYHSDDVCSGEGWTCDDTGNIAVNCTQNGAYAIDCGLLGGSCAPHASSVVPSAPACQPDSPPNCPNGAVEGNFLCDGTERFTCIDGQAYSVDCAALSASCINGGCSDRPDTCTTLGQVSCDEHVIDVCDSTGHRVRFDCSAEGMDCGVDSETGATTCLADGCETETGCTEGCAKDNKTLQFCVGGVTFAMDCTAYGFDTCSQDESDAGVPLAYCAMNVGSGLHP